MGEEICPQKREDLIVPAIVCQPANWQSPPTSRAPPLLTPCCIHKCTHMHQMLESQLPYVDSCMVLYKGCRLTWPKGERCQG